MLHRLVTYRPLPDSYRNRYRRLRRDHGGDILAGVPFPYTFWIELTRDEGGSMIISYTQNLTITLSNRRGYSTVPGNALRLILDRAENISFRIILF